MNNIIKRVWNQNRMVNIEDLSGAAFQAESGGHTFEISGVDDTGAAVALSGTVAGVFRRPDNADIALTGSASGGVASVTLTDDCYAVPGRFVLTIFVTSGGQKTAVYAAVGTVSATNGGAVAGDTPQDVVDLINAIEAAVATIPADYTDLMTSIAPVYSSSALYPLGAYSWHDGHLYRCTTPITTAETWTAAHWTATVLGDDVGDLKSAIGNVDFLQWTDGEVRNSWTLLTPTAKVGWACVVAQCSSGDVFSVKGYGGDNNRLWAFADSNGNAIILSDIIWTQDYIILVAPENAAYLVCNTDRSKTSYPASLLKGMPVENSLQSVQKISLMSPEILSGYSFDADDGWVRPTTGYTCYIYRVSLFAGGKASGRTGVAPNSYGIGFKDANGNFISGTKNPNTGHYDWNYEINIPSNAETLYISLRNASSSLWVDPKCEYNVALNKLSLLVPIVKDNITNGYYYDSIGGAMYADAGYNCYKYDVSLFNGGKISGRTGAVPNSGYGIGFTDANDKFISGASNPNTGSYEWKYDLVIPSGAKYIYISLRVASSDLWQEPLFPWEIVFNNLQNNIEITEDNNLLNNARHIKNDAATPLTILHLSDPHADKDALDRIVAQGKKLGKNIDGMICTGDITGDTAEQISSWWDASVMTCVGNHDCASYNSQSGQYNWTALSMANRDAYYIAPFEANWGITHTTGKSYYYKDYTAQKVRLIVMDGMLYTDNGADATAQTTWLSGLLSDAIANSLHVLIAIHAPHGGATPKSCSFTRYGQTTMPTYQDCNTPQVVIDAVSSAISNGLKFVGYIVGHTHQDNVWDAENNGKQLMYNVTCAAVRQKAQWIKSDQNRGISEDAYNLITIDTANTLIKIVRGGGADIDDHMRSRKAICFNYSTGEKVGEVL